MITVYTSLFCWWNSFTKALQNLLWKNIFTNNPRGQEEGVAWWHFCEIHFVTKQRNAKFARIFFHWNKLVYSILSGIGTDHGIATCILSGRIMGPTLPHYKGCFLLYIRAAIHHTSQHQRARRPARPLWPHLWLAKKSIAMAECSGSSYYNSLKSGKISVQWFFSYWWPILKWRQGKIQLWNDSLAAHWAQTHLHLCMYLMSYQRVTVIISELNFALSSLEYG